MRSLSRLAVCVSLFALAAPAVSQAPSPGEAAQTQAPQVEARIAALKASLKPRTGSIALPGAKARLELGQAYYFLDPDDSRKVLVDAWGNPPETMEGVLGMVFPAGQSFDNSWGAVVTFEDTGHVSDADAASQDYASVLRDMQTAAEEENEARAEQGYGKVHLVGWAQAPTYDPARKVLVWARELKFEGESENGLNYDVRTLGRTGVLSLNMVDDMDQLARVRRAAGELGRTAKFDPSARYADYNPRTDSTAEYGLAGLVAAGAGLGAAKKVGLLALLGAFAKKGIALIIALGLGAAAWFRRKFGGGYRAAEEDEQS